MTDAQIWLEPMDYWRHDRKAWMWRVEVDEEEEICFLSIEV